MHPLFLAAFISLQPARAQEAPSAPSSAAVAEPVTLPVTEPVAETVKARPKTRKKGSAPREKETEGTEALDRFEADTVIKSQYRLHGEHLEVDPD